MEFRIDFVTGIVIGASLWLQVTGQIYPNKIKGCISLTNIFEPCGCTISQETFDLLCASDAHTYLSQCSLNCQKALNKVLSLSVVHKGACSEGTKCTCKAGYVPQCGTDGVTYPNECVLNCFKQMNNSIQLKHTGECERVSNRIEHDESTNETEEPENETEEPENETEEPEYQKEKPENCQCQSRQSNEERRRRLRTRFGKNGKRYVRSSCGCRHKTKTEARRTPPPAKLTAQPPSCPLDNPPPIQPLTSQGCPNQPACQEKKKRCVCAMLHRPVCGSNNVTYVNFCALDCTSRKNPEVQFLYWGDCGKPQKTPWDFD